MVTARTQDLVEIDEEIRRFFSHEDVENVEVIRRVHNVNVSEFLLQFFDEESLGHFDLDRSV